MKKLLNLEYLSLILIILFIYFVVFNFSWWLLLLLLFTPDLSIVGYLINTKIGAYIYNVFHHLLFPSVLLTIALKANNELLMMLSLICYLHIYLDRLLGYGLKYTDSFQHTHLT